MPPGEFRIYHASGALCVPRARCVPACCAAHCMRFRALLTRRAAAAHSSEERLREFFGAFGAVTDVYLPRDRCGAALRCACSSKKHRKP
jgi:hypothetical protein